MSGRSHHRRCAASAGRKAGSAAARDYGRDARGGSERIEADTLAMSGGWNPELRLDLSPRRPAGVERGFGGLRARADAARTDVAVGAANGRMPLRDCLAEGSAAGRKAARGHGLRGVGRNSRRASDDETFAVTRALARAAARQGFRRFPERRHGRRYRAGGARGLPLGRASEALHHARHGDRPGQDRERQRPCHHGRAHRPGRSRQSGTTIYRPPYVPVAIGALAGHHRGKQFRPTRLTPSHHWAHEQGAVFVETGAWLRAQYFPRAGEKDWLETVTREVRAVRSASASAMSRPWARSTCTGRTPAPSSTASTSTHSRPCRSARRAMG